MALTRLLYKTVFLLGRWEPGCYKNVEAIFPIARALSYKIRRLKIFILASPEDIIIPFDLDRVITPIGYLPDDDLNCLMKSVDMGIGVSLWEGFNLPLAEMQWLRKPVLVFDVGAHPEVICHPWFLCKDMDDMIYKQQEIIINPGDSNAIAFLQKHGFRKLFDDDKLGILELEIS